MQKSVAVKQNVKTKTYAGVTVRQLPSGNWNAKLSMGKDSSGKRLVPLSITDPDPDEVGRQIIEFKKERKRKKIGNLTVEEAVDMYIDSRDASISPATIKEYIKYKRHLGEFGNMLVKNVDQQAMQSKANNLSKTDKADGKGKLSPKTVKNLIDLYRSAIRYSGNKCDFKLTLAEVEEKDFYMPTDEDVITLVSGSLGTKLGKAIILTLCNMDRRSQVSAIEYRDLDVYKSAIRSSRAIVLNKDNELVVKAPKSKAGSRETEVPPIVFELLGNGEPHEKVCGLKPHSITCMFSQLLKRLGLPHFRFHDLRHHGASVMHALGIPDKYAQKRGGWKTNYVYKKVYTHTLDKKQHEVDNKFNTRLGSLLAQATGQSIEKQHEKRHNIYRLVRSKAL